MLRISIIIPYFTPLTYLKTCIQALHQNTIYPIHEVIIVNDGAPDGTQLESFLQNVKHRVAFKIKLISRTQNRGFAYTCNEGAHNAVGQYLHFLNFDTLPQGGWLQAMAHEMQNHPNCGVVGSKLLYPGIHLIQHIGGAFDKHGNPVHIYRGQPAFLPFLDKARNLQWVTGASFLVKKEDFFQVSGFDELYETTSEDIDLCFKIRFNLGKEVRVAHHSLLFHYANATGITPKNMDRTYRLFLKRWGDRIVNDENEILEQDGFSPLFLRLLERIGIVHDLGKARLILSELNLEEIERQEVYVKTKGKKGLEADVLKIFPDFNCAHPGAKQFLELEAPGQPPQSSDSHNRSSVQEIIRILQREKHTLEEKKRIHARLLQRLDAMNLFLILYNIASMRVTEGKIRQGENLFHFLVENCRSIDPRLTGKAYFKLAQLTADAERQKDCLHQCLKLVPEHQAAQEALSQWGKKGKE